MEKNIIRAAVDITADEYESPAFVIEDESQMESGYWLMSASDSDYAEWYASEELARAAMEI